jgi:uncharacterized membrane protein YkvA (DUF1232 family)
VLIVVLLLLGRPRDAQKVVRFIPDCIVMLKRLLGDERVPLGAKLAVGLLLPYLVVPFDLIPDFIPVAGPIDDALLVAVVIAYVSRRAGRQVIAELWPGSDRGLRVVLAATRAS